MTDIKFIGTNQVELINSLSGTKISPASSGENFIEFSFNTLSKDNKDYYHFVITGSNVEVSGTIDSVTTKHQFVNLFKDQTAITAASGLELTAPIMREFCYSNMFLNCTSLKTPPSTLPAQYLDAWCYADMFAGCTTLTAAPTLPATELAKYCYYAMFYGCLKLVTPPLLPAYDLKEFCYNSMFYGCGCLGSNGSRCVINGADLIEGSCANMFVDCKNMGRIELYAGNWDTTPNTSAHCNATNIWTHNLPSTGFFGRIQLLEILRGLNYIPNNWSTGYDIPLIFQSTGNTQIALNVSGNITPSKFRVTKNWGVVSTYTIGDVIELEDGDIVTFRGDRPYLNTNSNYYYFSTSGTGSLSLSGWLGAMSRGKSNTHSVYRRLFYGCENIVDASKLEIPSSDFGGNAFASLFAGCTSLTGAPALPASTLTNSCYQYMFSGCTSLTKAPKLLAKEISNSCYKNMFYDCTSLTSIPTILPATTLAPSCYYGMFYGCTSLDHGPYLPAETMATSSYAWMFNRTSVNKLTAELTGWGDNYAYGWLWGVSPTGTFYKYKQLPETRGTSYIPTGWNIEYLPFTIEAHGDLIVQVANIYKDPMAYETYYNLNNEDYETDNEWKGLVYWDNKLGHGVVGTVAIKDGDKLKIKGSTHESLSHPLYRRRVYISGDGTFDVYGDLYSLNSSNSTVNSHDYDGLFINCTQLVDAKYLLMNTMNFGTLYEFEGGTSSYVGGEYGYASMFEGCTSLTAAPLLPATGLAEACYGGMFKNCYSLSTAPSLPATTLSSGCYTYMFSNCSSLLSGPYLPASSLVDSCYLAMFWNCSNLNTLCTNFRNWASGVNATSGWVHNVPTVSTGKFYKYSGLTTTRGLSYIPTNWTVTNR